MSTTLLRRGVLCLCLLAAWIAGAAPSHGAQPTPTTGYAPVNGLEMYYEVHGSGEPVVLLHGSFMTITSNWAGWIEELSKSRQVIAVEMQGHGRTADIERDFAFESLADDVAGLLDHLEIPAADIIGYSMGGGVALQCAIRHPEKVRRVVSISAVFRHDGWVQEALDLFPQLTADAFKGSPIEAEYKRLSPTPDQFPRFVERVIAMDLEPYDFGAEKLRDTKAPIFFVHGDADGVRLEHIAEMFRLKGGEVFGDLRPRSASRLAVLPNATHVTLMHRTRDIVPMVNDFLDAPDGHRPGSEPQAGAGARPEGKPLRVEYLEIVTPSVEETCDALAKAHGVTFGEPVAELANARTAELRGGGRIGVRAPMGPEAPVVRPYVLVDDIHAAIKAAEAAGAEVLMPPTETPGLCTFAIYYLGNVEHGLWQPSDR